jgi:hypothetical protein
MPQPITLKCAPDVNVSTSLNCYVKKYDERQDSTMSGADPCEHGNEPVLRMSAFMRFVYISLLEHRASEKCFVSL